MSEKYLYLVYSGKGVKEHKSSLNEALIFSKQLSEKTKELVFIYKPILKIEPEVKVKVTQLDNSFSFDKEILKEEKEENINENT